MSPRELYTVSKMMLSKIPQHKQHIDSPGNEKSGRGEGGGGGLMVVPIGCQQATPHPSLLPALSAVFYQLTVTASVTSYVARFIPVDLIRWT